MTFGSDRVRGGMKSLRRKCLLRVAGYSLVEMMVTLAIGLIMMAIALPALVSTIQGYRLSSIAQQTANLIDLARYAAIRHNAAVSLQKTVQNGNTVFFVDLDGDTRLGANEPMVMLPRTCNWQTAIRTRRNPRAPG